MDKDWYMYQNLRDARYWYTYFRIKKEVREAGMFSRMASENAVNPTKIPFPSESSWTIVQGNPESLRS